MKDATEDDPPSSSKPFGLEDGTCYLIPGKQSETSYLLFQGLVEGGTPGLCITRRYPEKVRSKYRLDSVPVWWISYAPGDQNYAPTAIGILAKVTETFIDENPRGSVVLLDGVESIMNSIGFDKALLFLEHVNEYVIARRAIMLFTVDPDCFKPSEFARLERTLQTIDEGALREAIENPEQYPRTGIQ
jgi:two-component system cell cycle response regulator